MQRRWTSAGDDLKQLHELYARPAAAGVTGARRSMPVVFSRHGLDLRPKRCVDAETAEVEILPAPLAWGFDGAGRCRRRSATNTSTRREFSESSLAEPGGRTCSSAAEQGRHGRRGFFCSCSGRRFRASRSRRPCRLVAALSSASRRLSDFSARACHAAGFFARQGRARRREPLITAARSSSPLPRQLTRGRHFS